MSESKIFAKYLPVEGEIKEGDIVIAPDYAGFLIVGQLDDMPLSKPHRMCVGLTSDTSFETYAVSELKLHKLHAVTTDIKIDEDVNFYEGSILREGKVLGYGRDKKASDYGVKIIWGTGWLWADWDKVFKILAPLSPHVTWGISDGQEIEGRIDIVTTGTNEFDFKEGDYFRVKGPCGHYH